MKLHLEGLRRRVVKYYFIMIIITVALFEVLFMFYMKEYYYSMAKSYLEQQVRYTQNSYDSSGMDSTSFQDKINNILEKESLSQDSSYKEVNNDFAVAIEIINKNKEIILDQYGIKTNEVVNYEDVNKALAGNEDYSFSISSIIETKDHIMSVSVPLKVNNVVEGVVRYSVSLNKADSAIFRVVFMIFIGGLVILLICLLISLRFADSLIRPIQDLKKTANQLAQGNYNIKLENEKLHDDEIGDLVRTFDHMAKEIDKTRKLKEEFISSVSHELRTPLTSIKGWSETLGYEGISREELDLGLGIIQDETERLITLVEELLDFSRLASDRIRLQIDTVNVVKLAKDVVNQLGVKASEKNITLLTEFNTKEREIADIQGDKNRLKQVLINLVQNALKFTEEGGYVVVRLSQGDEYTTFSVVDNGIGIKQENLDKVLEKFFQEDYHKSGSGIGLAISNEIVKLHKGKLILESQKGEGTCITFTLKNNLMDAIAEEKM